MFLLARMIGLGMATAAAFAAGFLAYLVSGSNQTVGMAAAWVVLAAAGVCLLPLIALAFNGFDVTRDVPA